MIWHDEGYGITDKSLTYFRQHRDRIGDVLGVVMKEGKWPLRILGEKGEIWLSGCLAGYGGKGPQGTHAILQELGYSEPHTCYPFERTRFELGPPGSPGVEETVPRGGLTARNLAVLHDIREFYVAQGRGPKAAELPGTSMGSTCHHLKRLEDAGKIKRSNRRVVWFEGMDK